MPRFQQQQIELCFHAMWPYYAQATWLDWAGPPDLKAADLPVDPRSSAAESSAKSKWVWIETDTLSSKGKHCWLSQRNMKAPEKSRLTKKKKILNMVYTFQPTEYRRLQRSQGLQKILNTVYNFWNIVFIQHSLMTVSSVFPLVSQILSNHSSPCLLSIS